MIQHLRYRAQHDPSIGCSEPFPWGVVDTLGADPGVEDTFRAVDMLPAHRVRLDWVGPCFSAADAAVIAWALSHRKELMRQYPDLRQLVDDCVSRTRDEEESSP